jgi:parallel beta-helix repeat protein
MSCSHRYLNYCRLQACQKGKESMKLGLSQAFRFGVLVLELILWIGVVGASLVQVPRGRIQAEIDDASPGATIPIPSGTYLENLVISKSLILKGEGQDKVIVKGAEEGRPAILIESDHPIEVQVKGFMITKGGVCIRGRAKAALSENKIANSEQDGILVWNWAQAIIENNRILNSKWNGIHAGYEAQVIVKNNEISGGREDGIVVSFSARATISNNLIKDNKGLYSRGILMENEAQATIENNEISGNREGGIWLRSSANALIKYNRIFDNGGFGISMWDLAQATIQNNRVTGNTIGIYMGGSAKATITNSIISGNRGNGIELAGSAHLNVLDSRIQENKHWEATFSNATATIKWGLIILGALLVGSLAWMNRRRLVQRSSGG